MAISPNIGADNLDHNSSNPEVPVNSAINKLDNSLNSTKSHTFADVNITIADADFLENMTHILGGSVTAQRDLIVPDQVTIGSDTITVSKYFIVEVNTTGGNIRVIPDGGTNSVILSVGDRVLLYTDGTDVTKVLHLPRVARDDHAYPTFEVVHMIDVPDGATGDIDVTIDEAMRVFDVKVIKAGAAGGVSDTVQVKNSTNAITDAMSLNVADQIIVKPTTIDDQYWDIASGGTLRVTRTKVSAANVACKVFVKGVLI